MREIWREKLLVVLFSCLRLVGSNWRVLVYLGSVLGGKEVEQEEF